MGKTAIPYVVDAVDEFVRTKAPREKKTQAAYISVLRGKERGTRKPLGLPFAVYFSNRRFDSITPDEVVSWFGQRVEGGAQTTKHRISKTTREFLNWSSRRGYTTAQVAEALDPYRPGKSTRPNIDWPDVYRLISAIPEDRYRFAVRWLFYTGCRVSEAIAARQRDVIWHADVAMFEWTIPDSKTDEARHVWLPDELATALRATREMNKPKPDWPILWDCEGRGFARVESPAAPISNRTINGVLRRAADQIGLMIDVTAHVAKHSYCTNWVKEFKRDEYAMEKLSRQVGTSVANLRKTYVKYNLTPDEWAQIKRFGSPPVADTG